MDADASQTEANRILPESRWHKCGGRKEGAEKRLLQPCLCRHSTCPTGGTRLRCDRGCMQGLEGSSWNPTCTRAPASPQVPKGHAEEPGNSPGLLWEGKELTLPQNTPGLTLEQ